TPGSVLIRPSSLSATWLNIRVRIALRKVTLGAGDCWGLIVLARVFPWSIIAVIVVRGSARLIVALIPIAVSRSMFFVPTTRLAAVASWLIAVRARVVARTS